MKTLITAIFLTCISMNSFAGDNGNRHMGKMAERLDLSETQIEQVKAIYQSKKEQKQALKLQLKALHDQTSAEIMTILTPEQQESFAQMQEKLEKRMRHRKKNH